MNYEGKALTIAGSDSGGGAGIQADLKTFQSLNVFGMSVITSVTSQNTKGVRSIQDISPEIVGDQIDMVMEDIGTDAVKTGMLANKQIIEIVANRIKKHNIKNLVIDPVMISKSGARLLKKEAVSSLIKELIPLCFLLTPNIYEAQIISNITIKNIEDAKKSAILINKKGPKNLLIKGGHLAGDKAIDILYNGREFVFFEEKQIHSKNTHGTGCTLSAAITAELAKGKKLINAVKIAKKYITDAISNAPDNIGNGHGPLYHPIIYKDYNK